MQNKTHWLSRNVHLLISIVIVVPTALIYGSPSILPHQLDIQVNSIDLANMLKAIMCLYLGTSLVWALGMWNVKYWTSATQLNMLFMWTLAIGRTWSMLTDGLPTGGYIFGVVAEIALGLLAVYQLKKFALEEGPL